MKARFVAILSAMMGVGLVAATSTPTFAQVPPQDEVIALTGAPPELARWAGWVMHGQVGYRCAYRNGSSHEGPDGRACVSVSPLEVSPSSSGSSFRFEVSMDEAGVLPLPSSLGVWPQDVRVEGLPAELMKDAQGQWQVVLKEGRAVVEGRWPSLVSQIQAPPVFAHATNVQTGQALAVEKGTVWVEGRPLTPNPDATAPVAPTAQVWRLLEDGAVPRLTTHVTLTVPQPERLVLGPVLPTGFEPVSWTSNAQLSLLEGGTIHLQAGRGVVSVELVARCTQACAEQPDEALPPIAPPTATDSVWPSSEVWSFQANPTFRHLTATGPGVDPAAAGVPEAWAHLPAFRLTSSQTLAFRTVSRGPGAVQGEGLTLWRRVWHTPAQWLQLDFLHGQLPSPGRLTMASPHQLESAHSTASPLPLTVLEEGGAPGVQWPTTNVEMLAQSVRSEGTDLTPGWTQPISGMHVLLHLPVGEVLLAAPGNQNRATEWVDNFTLLRFFAIALLGFIVFHLRHHRLILTPLAVVLAAGWVHNPAAQALLVLMGGVGALLIVASALAPGRARLALRSASTLAVGLALVAITPFIIAQTHHLLYPDHQPYRSAYAGSFTPPSSSALVSDLMIGTDFGGSMGIQNQEASVSTRAAGRFAMEDHAVSSMDGIAAEKMTSAPMPSAPMPTELQRDPLSGLGLARVGTALPQWPHQLTNSYQLHYPGPLLPSAVEADRFSLWIFPAWATWIARLLGSVGLLVLLAGLVQRVYLEWREEKDNPTNDAKRSGPAPSAPPALASLAVMALVFGSMAPAGQAMAQPVPPQAPQLSVEREDHLDELRRRLMSLPACAPACATLTHATLAAEGSRARATYLVSSQADATWTPPTPQGGVLESARVNDQPALFHGVEVRIPAGRSRLEVVYLIESDPFVLEFHHSPLAVVERLGPGWVSEGVDASGRLSAATGASWVLKPTQAEQATVRGAAPLPESVDPVVLAHLERGFDFSRSVSVDYRLSRLDSINRAMTVSWAKLPGESVDSDRVEDKGDRWEATLAANEPFLSWHSTLPSSTSTLAVESLPATVGQESWRVSSSPAWELGMEGVPATQASEQGNITLLPLPGETLKLDGRRLSVLDGPTQRLDKVHVSTTAGARTARHELSLELFTTQAGSRAIGLPEGASLVSVSRNGQDLPLPLENGRLDVPLERGAQSVLVVFQSPVGKALLKAPAISFDGRAANLHWDLDPGDRRWVLAAGGPGAGPAIFYWPLLLVFMVMAWAVARLPHSPMSGPTALLLTLGLSMLPHTLIMLMSLVGWLWLIRYRASLDVDTIPAPRFRALQVGFVLLTAWCALLVLGNLGWGLIGASPDMMIEGYDGSQNSLAWYLPSHPEGIPALPWVFSLPVWVYQAILLAWSLWFTAWLFAAGKRALGAFTQGGHWRARVRLAPPPPSVPPPQS